ncbi:DUF3265 domain-containing protein [Vibrio cholerae]|nr:DUF3265 domain-containing protein [Vibrio cholerae]
MYISGYISQQAQGYSRWSLKLLLREWFSLTNCLRVIRNAWRFYYALAYVFNVVCGGFGIALLTP